jgi:hypothetical protein
MAGDAGAADPVGVAGVAATIEMGVPASYAFDFLADPSTAVVIDPAVREYRPDALPMGLGTRTAVRFRMWGVPVRARSVVTAWEPGVRMAMESERPARPVRVVAHHDFAPTGSASCAYTWQIEVVPTGPFGSLAARLLARFLRSNADAQQARFKAEVERRWSTDPGAC